ncbi:hypothetical protein BOO69_17110 [Sulfitobacter alexandrii]|uniref:Uncharacterized protein n=1 Tax=Sulfitobacter alexandrii TaxID=1917485 RepID=A0A1J0WL85_9RHOB|nr:hypothetical protein [Sulfitobacter alexandrii]APE44934.1 hypothetical protein BOO69_17110 [Sulfitobacter alexandrii]
MLIRTVLDCRPDSPKYLCGVLLLSASWARRVAPTAPLEVLLIGDPPETLLGFFAKMGVRWQMVNPDPELAFVPTGNTLLGAEARGEEERILLVDNDICFLSDVKPLLAIPPNRMAGAPAGNVRVTEAQWAEIESALDLAPLRHLWTETQSQMAALQSDDVEIRQNTHTYVNGGVLLLPQDDAFVATWRDHLLRIAAHFRGHPLRSKAVLESNMAGLATAIGAHGDFQWLPDGMNCRHRSLLLNVLPLEEIDILHMTGGPATEGDFPPDSHVSAYVAGYWQTRVMDKLTLLETAHGPRAFAEATDTVRAIMAETADLIRAYDLDAVMAMILEERRGAR